MSVRNPMRILRHIEPIASPVPAPGAPTVSIVILTFNALEDTQACLRSVAAHSTVPHEIIVVDNASSDGTPSYLREWAADRPNAKLVLNHENTGFAGGNNIGMAISRGRYLVLLNNDTVVTPGWLERMVAVCDRHPDVALVGPRSNSVSGPQLVSHAPYQSEEQMMAFANRWTRDHLGKDELTLRLVGFCLLVRRELVDAIGGLDERFGRGNFEDDDFCLRAVAAGFRARIAHDVFIHHSGSKSFKAANIDYNQALETNWRIFKAKWGVPAEQPLDQGYARTLAPTEQSMQFVNLPEITTTHHTDSEERIYQQGPAPVAQEAPIAATRAKPPSKSEMSFLFDAGEAAALDGNWQRSAEIFAEMVKRAPTFGPAYVGFASAAFATGQLDAGIVALEHACTIYPDNAQLRTQLAVALAHAGHPDRAQQAFVEVLDIDNDNLDAIVSLAHLCRASRNFVEAVDLLAHAERLAPESPEVLGAISITALDLGDPAGARVAFDKLAMLAPDHVETAQLAPNFGAS